WQLYLENLGELSDEALNDLISHVGRRVEASELPKLMDFAFLALHGPGGEDGAIQGLLEWVGIPYSGSGILPSAFGIDKIAQKRLMQAVGLATPKFRVVHLADTFSGSHFLHDLVQELGLPLVVKAPRQGSSIGVSIVREENETQLKQAIQSALFSQGLKREEWEKLSETEQLAWVRQLADIREGYGLPVQVSAYDNFRENHESLLDENKKFIQSSLELIARLGGDHYCRVSKESLFIVPKPNVKLGIGIDASDADVRAAYPGIVAEPHKYIDAPGRYLTWIPQADGPGLRFEIGTDGKVSMIHAGVMPWLGYVEGCA
ncbi:MAG: hypothetical protein EOO63_16155, partial [Hymenobacter sp.]